MLISFDGRGKNGLAPGEVSMGDATVLPHCSLLKKFFTKTGQCAVTLSWWRKQLRFFHFSWRFLLTASTSQRK